MAQKTISSDQTGTRALRRVAHHYLRQAERCLARPLPSDTAVHDVRKALKRSRTALRLLRPALGRKRYRYENAALRDAAHALNPARDTSVLVGTLETLRRSDRSLRDSPAVTELARELHGAQSAARYRLQTHQILDPLRRSTHSSDRRARRWPVGRHGWSVIGPALRRIYGAGRRAMPAVVTADTALHEWRKQVKYLRYALQMLVPISPGPLGGLVRRAKVLSDRLGEAHDLAVLAQQVREKQGARVRPHSGNGADLQELLELIERQRERLALQALAAGGALYRRRPRVFVHRIGRDWRRWRRLGD